MLWKKHALYKNYTLQEVRDELDAVEQFGQQGKRPHYGELTGKNANCMKTSELNRPACYKRPGLQVAPQHQDLCTLLQQPTEALVTPVQDTGIVYYAQATAEQNDDTTGNQPDGAKLSYAYANVKVKPSGLQVKKSVKKAIFSPQTLTFAPPYRYGLLNGLNAEICLINTKTQTIDERLFSLTLNQSCPGIPDHFTSI